MRNQSRFLSRWLAFIVCALMLPGLSGCGAKKDSASALDPKSPVTVTVWNYYTGDQLAAFDQLVEEFNTSVGVEKGVVVVSVSQGDIDTLADSLLASVNGEAGASKRPSVAAVYAETAYILEKAGALAPLDGYFTADELASYVPGFLEEGRFNAKNELLLFPILKSTELFTANKTDWAPFAEATGVALESITTKEQLTAAAKTYYEWTDAQTPDVAGDGKALYGRDSVPNYIYIGTYQLGHEMFAVKDGALTVDLDKETFRTLWDNYYIPMINGWFGAYAKFRSEDCKTGKILALTSSSSSVSYLPTAVTLSDDTSHDIETYASRDLPFENASVDAVVQQGASYCLLRSTDAEQEGAVTFLKWFTEPDRNLDFALMSGYSPVTLGANTEEAITSAFSGDVSTPKGQNVLKSLVIGAETFSECKAYSTKPFEGSKDVRYLLGDLLQNTAADDRAAIVAAIASGKTQEEATAEFMSDAYFDAFFDRLTTEVTAIVK